MTKYVWKATDQGGNEVVRETMAASAAAAQAALLAEGYTGLALMESEVIEAVLEAFPQTATLLGQEVKVTAAQRVGRYNKRATYMRAICEGIGQSKSVVLFLVALVALFLYWRFYISASLAVVALVAWLLFNVTVAAPAVLYRRLHRAGDWHRWEEVQGLVEKLEHVNRIHFAKVPAVELARWRAKVLIGEGRLSEALASYEPYENQPGCPSWLYQLFVAGLYDLAKQHDLAIEWTLRSLYQKPTSTAYLDLANRYLRYKQDTAKAREALTEVDKEPISELAKPFRIRCQGILALLEGDYPTARQNLEATIDLMERTRDVPFRDGNISVAKAFLCCVLAKQGEMEGARAAYDASERYLRATDEHTLLAECKRALGLERRL